MEADFSGYATKAGVRCTDGRTIASGAFKHQDTMQVPLVWQHGHDKPGNVLGHAILEERPDGVYAYGFFNKSQSALEAAEAVVHGDVNQMSIWANDLVEKAGRVLHGAIREVSLVLSGANPGAVIENVSVRHSDGMVEVQDDEAIIYLGGEITHSASPVEQEDDTTSVTDAAKADEKDDDDAGTLEHDDLDNQVVYDSMTEVQQSLLHSMVSDALDSGEENPLEHAALGDDATVKEVYESMNEQQKQVLHYMLGEAVSASKEAKHDNVGDDKEGSNTMTRNVFEQSGDATNTTHAISHSDLKGIVADATKNGSFKDAVENYALAHGINDIDTLFPDAKAIDAVPEFLARRSEWVSTLLSGVRKSPFSRIKTLHADITMDEARARGYVTGSMKKEEYFDVSKRTTTPTTIYKKQKLERDDMLDITDFDVVAWLKGEMRLMLDEEIARAILVGDGRDIASEDKINPGNIRPIAYDHTLYTTKLNVNIDDANSSVQEIIDQIVLNRYAYKGSGQPTMFTTEHYIARFLLLKDTLGRRIYKSLPELATELRVSAIVPVEVMEEYADLVAVLVNPADYIVGATAGGQVSMFDDFDIDWNQHKYLIETRMCGALTKMKSAIALFKTAATITIVQPTVPAFDPSDGELVITDTVGVVYTSDVRGVVNAAGSPYTVTTATTETVTATPAATYAFSTSEDTVWEFTAE